MEMDIKIGDISGCLEIIGDCIESENDLQETINQWAEKEWYKFEDWHTLKYMDFKTKYKLNKQESQIYDARGTMPKSFVAKFRKNSDRMLWNIIKDGRFLWHDRKPNTNHLVVKGCREKKLYKVKCNVCNRIFYMDSESFNCVKWRSCVGVECLENTVNEEGIDYSKNWYDWNSSKNELQKLDSLLAKVEELSNPLTYYGGESSYQRLRMAYISDIHLDYHLKYYSNEKRMIRDIVDKLYQSKGSADIILFGGDIASSKKMTMDFFSCFKRKNDFGFFSRFKQEVYHLKRLKKELLNNPESKYVKCQNKISMYIEKRKRDLIESFDFSVFESYKNAYHPIESYETAFKSFKLVKSYKKYDVSEQTEMQIFEIAKLIDIRNGYDSKIAEFEQLQKMIRDSIGTYEEKYSKAMEDIYFTDYEHVLLHNVFVALGNHEYIEFPDVESGVSYYSEQLSKLGITLLHNSCYLDGEDKKDKDNDHSSKFLIYGGTGFAKYDEKWNANSIICCSDFTREDEIKETTLFETGYRNALEYAKKNGLCFICLSHYPVSACLNNVFDKEAIYFTGHSHNNKFVKTTDRVLYADNQIGYKDNNIVFRIATTGYELNPYSGLSDGLYQTTIPDYIQFYRYIGENVGKGNLLYQRCQNGKANLYVLKRKGYYGFFIITLKGDSKSKGISIVNGGVTKKITNSTDMAWICENFDVVLSKYLQLLMPLRMVQDELSKELKELGLDGIIHGCIVDIDFYHHIMINPSEGSMTFYYSPIFGMAKKLDSFEEVIKSLEENKSMYDRYDCSLIRKKYDEKLRDRGYLLGTPSNNNLLEIENDEMEGILEKEYQIVSRSEGMYGISRKINPIQRLFSGHVLRDFDLRLTETKQQPYRKFLYTNRVFMYEGIRYLVVEDDGSDIIVAEEFSEDSEAKGNEIKLIGNTRKFAITALRAKIKNKDEHDTYWIS